MTNDPPLLPEETALLQSFRAEIEAVLERYKVHSFAASVKLNQSEEGDSIGSHFSRGCVICAAAALIEHLRQPDMRMPVAVAIEDAKAAELANMPTAVSRHIH